MEKIRCEKFGSCIRECACPHRIWHTKNINCLDECPTYFNEHIKCMDIRMIRKTKLKILENEHLH